MQKRVEKRFHVPYFCKRMQQSILSFSGCEGPEYDRNMEDFETLDLLFTPIFTIVATIYSTYNLAQFPSPPGSCN